MRMIHPFYMIENILLLKLWIVLNFHRVRGLKMSQNVLRLQTEVLLETIFWVWVQESTILILRVCVFSWCSTLCDPKYCSLPGSSVHGVAQPMIQERVPIFSSRGSSQPRDWTHISCIGRQILYPRATWEAGPSKGKRVEMQGGSVELTARGCFSAQ